MARRPISYSDRNTRRVAADVLLRWLAAGTPPDRMLDRVVRHHAFVMEVVLGVVRQFRALTWIREQLAPRRPSPRFESLLLVGLYQLLFMENVPEFAAVHETVEAAKRGTGARCARLVNAVLRRALREKTPLRDALQRQPGGVRLSHPDLLVERWTRALGAENALRLCEWNNQRPAVALRINRARIDLQSFLHALRSARLAATLHPFSPHQYLVLPAGAAVADLPGYAEGFFWVQDPSGSVAPDLLAPRPGERVLDACAAPGGKTAALAEAMSGQGTLLATDATPPRVDVLRQNLARLRWSFVETLEADAADATALAAAARARGIAGFDAVLLDAPCTNTGVIRRRPDARWRFDLPRLASACAKQRALLDSAARVLAPGGRIVYSTCSLEPEENEELVGAWLAAHPAFRLADSRKLVPPEPGTDGAYAALLVTKEDPSRG